MKKKLLILLIRLIRFFHAEKTFLPDLQAVDPDKVLPNHFYSYYGRILISRPWTEEVREIYEQKVLEQSAKNVGDWVRISKELFYTMHSCLEKEEFKKQYRMRVEGSLPCEHCVMHQKGLPCRCDFQEGTAKGYFQLIMENKQYSDNVKV